MRVNEYLSVVLFQLKVELDCNSQKEYLIETEEVQRQLEVAFQKIKELKPDVALFPEMTYLVQYEPQYKQLSKGRIIVAGSYYQDGINTTVVFENGTKHKIPKGYASGAEPMARKITYVPPEEFLKKQIKLHEFWVKGKKIYILNCMEYYHSYTFTARR